MYPETVQQPSCFRVPGEPTSDPEIGLHQTEAPKAGKGETRVLPVLTWPSDRRVLHSATTLSRRSATHVARPPRHRPSDLRATFARGEFVATASSVPFHSVNAAGNRRYTNSEIGAHRVSSGAVALRPGTGLFGRRRTFLAGFLDGTPATYSSRLLVFIFVKERVFVRER